MHLIKNRTYDFQYDLIVMPIKQDIETCILTPNPAIAVIRASTGAGKTTLFPMLIAEAGRQLIQANKVGLVYLFCGTVPVVEQTFDKIINNLELIKDHSEAKRIVFVGRGQNFAAPEYVFSMTSAEYAKFQPLDGDLIIYQNTTHHLQSFDDFTVLNQYPSILFIDELHFGGTTDPSLLVLNTGHENQNSKCTWQKQLRRIKFSSAYGFTATVLNEMLDEDIGTYRLLSEVDKSYTIDRNKLASTVFECHRNKEKPHSDQVLKRKIIEQSNKIYRSTGTKLRAYTHSVDPMTELIVIKTVMRNNELFDICKETNTPFKKAVALIFASSDKRNDPASTYNICNDITKILDKLEAGGIFNPNIFQHKTKERAIIYKSEFKGYADRNGPIYPGWNNLAVPTAKLDEALQKNDNVLFVIALRSLRLGFSADNINSVSIFGECKNEEFITTSIEQILGRANRFNIPGFNNWVDFAKTLKNNSQRKNLIKLSLLCNTFEVFHTGSVYVTNGVQKYFERQILEHTKTKQYLKDVFKTHAY